VMPPAQHAQHAYLPACLPVPGCAVKDIRALLSDRTPLQTARGMGHAKHAVTLQPDRFDVVRPALLPACCNFGNSNGM
jgi:hypothetical protein